MTEKALSPRSVARYVATVAAIGFVYFAAARLGLSLAFATSQVTAVWPPSGIAFCALLLFGYSIWPGVYGGALLVNALSAEPFATAAGIAAGNTAEAVVGVYLLSRLAGFDGSIDKVRNVLALTGLAALLSTMVGATLGVANLCLGGVVAWSDYGSVWWVWWTGDAVGVLLVAPVILVWWREPRLDWRGRRLFELVLVTVALVLVGLVVFFGRPGGPDFDREYAVFPFLIWAALRFGPRETASLVLLVSAIAIGGALSGAGPFATATTPDSRLVLLDVFVATSGVTALLLAAVTAERRRAQERLHDVHDELELRVQERTAELGTAVAELNRVNQALTERTTELASRNEEVEGFVYAASHDLRAPLVTLQGFAGELGLSCRQLADLLDDAALPAGIAGAVRPILDDDIPTALRHLSAGTARFQRLIDALIALSRSARQEYRSDEVDVQALVATTLDSLRPSIQTRGAVVSVRDLPAALGDSNAIARVFSNLIGNAVNYLEPGRPGMIEVEGITEQGAAHYWVRDNGSGIPPTAEPRLFQPFQRFHPTLAPGLGMGLAMVKRIVERLGGKVWFESPEGPGTAFHVTLPAAKSQREPLGGQGV